MGILLQSAYTHTHTHTTSTLKRTHTTCTLTHSYTHHDSLVENTVFLSCQTCGKEGVNERERCSRETRVSQGTAERGVEWSLCMRAWIRVKDRGTVSLVCICVSVTGIHGVTLSSHIGKWIHPIGHTHACITLCVSLGWSNTCMCSSQFHPI